MAAMRIFSVDGGAVEAQAVFEHEGFKISCTTILCKVAEVRIFDQKHQDVTDRIMPLEKGPITATAANLVRIVAGIDYYLLVTREP
jgi:hypothetical protein